MITRKQLAVLYNTTTYHIRKGLKACGLHDEKGPGKRPTLTQREVDILKRHLGEPAPVKR